MFRFLRFGARKSSQGAAPNPVPATEWRALGNDALAAGDLQKARQRYEAGIAEHPHDTLLRLNLGYVLLEQGEHHAAARALSQALSLPQPGDGFAPDAHFLLGRAHAAAEDVPAALVHLRLAADDRPGFVEPVEFAASLCHAQQRHAECIEWSRRLLELRPTAFGRFLLGASLAATHADEEASALLAQVIAEQPEQLDAALLLCQVLFRQRRYPEALRELEALMLRAGRRAELLAMASVILEKLNRLDEALACADEALRLNPRERDAHFSRVVIFLAQGRDAEAVAAAHAGLEVYPEDADIHWVLSHALLAQGRFAEGWREQEWRIRSASFTGWRADAHHAPWAGESLEGKTLLLYGEQGFGDSLQFARFAPLLARTAREVLLAVPQQLQSLMEGLAPNCRIVPAGSPVPDFDFHCALMSVPHVLGLDGDTFPASVPYLRAEPQRTRAWAEILGDAPGLKVGIAWAGRPTHPNDLNRSMSLETLRRVAVPGCRFFTIQPELPARDRAALAGWSALTDTGSRLADFSDTAALMEALDLVISVDTSVAHLAGALGRPVWVLLAHPPEWRWMKEGPHSSWYPTARLFRQQASRSWEPVLEEVRQALAALSPP
jgi:tetratricopeptide (TPR) repeat protein